MGKIQKATPEQLIELAKKGIRPNLEPLFKNVQLHNISDEAIVEFTELVHEVNASISEVETRIIGTYEECFAKLKYIEISLRQNNQKEALEDAKHFKELLATLPEGHADIDKVFKQLIAKAGKLKLASDHLKDIIKSEERKANHFLDDLEHFFEKEL